MSDVTLLPEVEYEGVHCALTIRRPAPGIAVVILRGSDVGEFADFPMRELGKDLERYGALELFIDARAVRGASVQVSSAWAFWLRTNARRLNQICMLTGSRYIQITAQFARRFVDLGDQMKLFTDATAFEEALERSIADAGARPAAAG